MYTSIVVGTDGSPTAAEARNRAAGLAGVLGAKLHVVSAYRDPVVAIAPHGGVPVDPGDWKLELQVETEAMLASVAEKVAADGVEVEIHSVAGHPVRAILAVARDGNAGLVVVGNKGMRGARRVLGSVPNPVHPRSCQPADSCYCRHMQTRILSATPAPLEVVEGDCGLSFVEMELDAVGWYRVRTGFQVDRNAVEYHWKVNGVGPGLNRDHTWRGPLRFRQTWRGSRRGDIKSEGIHEATVVPPASYAVFFDGGVCYSGGPRDREYIF